MHVYICSKASLSLSLSPLYQWHLICYLPSELCFIDVIECNLVIDWFYKFFKKKKKGLGCKVSLWWCERDTLGLLLTHSIDLPHAILFFDEWHANSFFLFFFDEWHANSTPIELVCAYRQPTVLVLSSHDKTNYSMPMTSIIS